MKIHPTEVSDWTLEELAQSVAGMRYDRVVYFLECFEEEISRQSESDKKINRDKLCLLLTRAKTQIGILISIFQDMVDGPCKKYIEVEKEQRGEE
jgi:hypothetical protein